MSKVKIQGNASGTGVLTVTAPNTSTDRTITLPDATGTLATTADVPSSITDNGDATAITINSSEQVGIGTTSPNETLRVGGTVKIAPTNQTGTLAFGGTDNSNVHVGIFRGAANSLSAGNSLNLAGYSSITFSASAALVGSQTERMRVTSDGLTFNGDTAAANALDDYEEGNWTPTWSPTGGSWSGTGVGKYTKIGRQVTASFNWIASAQATGTKFNSVGGLPFTSLNETTRYPATVSLNNAGYADHILMPTMSANSTSINLQMQSQSTGSHGEFTPSMTTSSTEISLTITYMTA